MIITCVFKNVNKLDSSMRVHQNTWGRVSWAQKLGQERDKGVQSFHSIWGCSVDAGRCTDEPWQFQCTCTVVFPLEDQRRWSWCHEVMSWGSLMLSREGTIKGEHIRTLGLLSGYSRTKHLGLLTSHRPFNLAVSVPLEEKSITRMDSVTYLSICMYPDLSGEPLVSVTSVVWWYLGRSLPSPLEPGIEWSTDHNPLVANCKGRINH